MATTVPRNAPCPCGSGKKYKVCCLGKTQIPKKSFAIPIAICVIGIIAGVIVGWQTKPTTGLGIFIGTLLLVGIGVMVRRPPPPGGGGDAAGLNFGRKK